MYVGRRSDLKKSGKFKIVGQKSGNFIHRCQKLQDARSAPQGRKNTRNDACCRIQSSKSASVALLNLFYKINTKMLTLRVRFRIGSTDHQANILESIKKVAPWWILACSSSECSPSDRLRGVSRWHKWSVIDVGVPIVKVPKRCSLMGPSLLIFRKLPLWQAERGV